jgi:signal transduction histidine kinase
MIEGFTEEMNIKAMQIDLDTIFNNLLSNSIYAIKETKSNQNRNITIKGNCTGNIVQISFVDTGIGLAEEYKSHVNDIFNAFESSKVDEEGNKIGTGLGLYITKTTIEKYKGDISIIPNMVQGFGLIVSLNKV